MRLFLECKPDETLAITLGVPRRSIVHSHGKGRVSNHLKKNAGATGFVDEDLGSTEPTTLGKFIEQSASHDVKLKTDPAQNNKLVVVCPKLEDWLIKTTKQAGLRMADFGLSDNPSDLHADINQRLPNLQRLLAALLEAQNPRLLRLQSLLKD